MEKSNWPRLIDVFGDILGIQPREKITVSMVVVCKLFSKKINFILYRTLADMESQSESYVGMDAVSPLCT